MRTFTSSLTVGAVQGFDTLTMALALGALFFSGPFANGYGVGVGAILLGSALVTFYVAWRSSLPSSLAHVQETTVAVVASAIVAASVQAGGAGGINTASILAIIGLSSLVVGLFCWLSGFFKLGGLLRFLPYPVVAGFLAGTGWLLIDGANIVLTGHHLDLQLASSLADRDVALRWGLALALALVLLLTLARFPNPFALAGVILGSGLLFAAFLVATSTPLEALRAMGLLPDLASASGLSLPHPGLLAEVDWALVISFTPVFLAVAGLNLVGLTLNLTGIEVALGRDLDTNKELRTNAIANVLAGAVGGAPGYTGLSMTLLSEHVGARQRAVGISAAICVVSAMLFAGDWVSFVPVFMTSGMLLFLGLGLLHTWLVKTRARMPLSEWLIVVIILLTIAVFGFMEGIVVGLLVSSIMFVFNYAQLPVVRRDASLAEIRSTVDRSPDERSLLARDGAKTVILQLQGYLFFGTSERVVDLVRTRIARADEPKVDRFIIDFSDVSGADSAAGSCFVKVQRLAAKEGLTVIFVHISESLARQFTAAGIAFGATSPLRLEQDFDTALEHAEETVLRDLQRDTGQQSLEGFLGSLVGQDPDLPALIGKLSSSALEPGDTLITSGATCKDVYFVEQGRVSVRIPHDDGTMLRVRSMVAGAIVGEMALYRDEKRSADVVVDTPSRVYTLSEAVLAQLQQEEPRLAALLHRILATSLAEKLATANQTRAVR